MKRLRWCLAVRTAGAFPAALTDVRQSFELGGLVFAECALDDAALAAAEAAGDVDVLGTLETPIADMAAPRQAALAALPGVAVDAQRDHLLHVLRKARTAAGLTWREVRIEGVS